MARGQKRAKRVRRSNGRASSTRKRSYRCPFVSKKIHRKKRRVRKTRRTHRMRGGMQQGTRQVSDASLADSPFSEPGGGQKSPSTLEQGKKNPSALASMLARAPARAEREAAAAAAEDSGPTTPLAQVEYKRYIRAGAERMLAEIEAGEAARQGAPQGRPALMTLPASVRPAVRELYKLQDGEPSRFTSLEEAKRNVTAAFADYDSSSTVSREESQADAAASVPPPPRGRIERYTMQVPVGMSPGQQISFKASDSKMYDAPIPQGFYSGQNFTVEVELPKCPCRTSEASGASGPLGVS